MPPSAFLAGLVDLASSGQAGGFGDAGCGLENSIQNLLFKCPDI